MSSVVKVVAYFGEGLKAVVDVGVGVGGVGVGPIVAVVVDAAAVVVAGRLLVSASTQRPLSSVVVVDVPVLGMDPRVVDVAVVVVAEGGTDPRDVGNAVFVGLISPILPLPLASPVEVVAVLGKDREGLTDSVAFPGLGVAFLAVGAVVRGP